MDDCWLMIDALSPRGNTLKNSTVSDCCITCYATIGKGVVKFVMRLSGKESHRLLCNNKRCVLIIVSHDCYLQNLRRLYYIANIFIKLRKISDIISIILTL